MESRRKLPYPLSLWERAGVRGVTEQKPPLFADTLDHARRLRRAASKAEIKLWRRLRNRGLAAAKFRRQCPVGSYVVDFYCDQARLVVELDGGGHAQEEQKPRDVQRADDIEALGVRVLCFWNGDVLSNVEGVLQRILAALERPSP